MKNCKAIPKTKKEFKTLIVYPNLALMLVPSLAIALFTKIFKKEGYIVDLFDTTHYISEENSSPQNRVKFLQARKFSDEDDLGIGIKTDLLGDFKRKVTEYRPDLIIFSVVEDAFRQALKMIESIQDLKIPHLVGGVFPTAAPERCMEYSSINMIGIGEGEKTIVNVAEAVRLGKSLKNIPNTWFRERDTIYKAPRDTLVNINDYRADFSLFDEKRFYRPMGGHIFKTIPVETYRGCPYRCTYCNSPMQVALAKKSKQGKFLRRTNIHEIRDRLKDLVKLYDPEFFYFIDDSFLARPKKEILEFCDMYEEFKLPFWFNTRPENCDSLSLKRLKEVGAYRISFGIECGNEDFRRQVLKRANSNEEIVKHFKVIEESGIAFSINLIIGFPGETRDLIMDTVELVSIIGGYDSVTVSIFTPYHGTVLREIAVKNGWLDSKLITTHTTSSSILKMTKPYVSSDDINMLMRVIPLYCYFPKSEWPKIKRAEIDDEEGNKILTHYSKIYKENFLKETQEDNKIMVNGGSGCSSNAKDSIFVYTKPMMPDQLEMLTI